MTEATTTQAQYPKWGNLYDYHTGAFIRRATREELIASLEAARKDGGAGVIKVEDKECYVV